MKVRMRLIVPVLLVLGGCATSDPVMTSDTSPGTPVSAAAPARVDAVSATLGQRLDNIVAGQRGNPVTMTR